MYAQRKKLYKKIEAFTDSRVLCYVTGDRQSLEIQIAPDALDHFADHLPESVTPTPKTKTPRRSSAAKSTLYGV